MLQGVKTSKTLIRPVSLSSQYLKRTLMKDERLGLHADDTDNTAKRTN